MNITALPDWYRIDDQIILFASEPVSGQINLSKTRGEVMTYGQHDTFVINYAWEYDKDSIDITCFAEADGTLDYLIISAGTKIAVIQTAKALEFDGFTTIDEWIVPDTQLADQLAQMELEGTVHVLSTLTGE